MIFMLLSFQEMPSNSLQITSEATIFLVRGLPLVVNCFSYLKRLPWQGVDYNFIFLYNFQLLSNRVLMYRIIITLLTLLFVISNSKVIQLDDSNYITFINTHNYVFVKFYLPNCSHCIAMAEDYQKLAEVSVNKEYLIAQVDATAAKNIQKQLQIQRFPAIKFLVHGHVIDYLGKRTTKDMQNWLQSQMISVIKQITKDQRQKLSDQNIIVIQGASREQLELLSFTQKINQIPYYHVDSNQFAITIHLANSKKFQYSGEITIKKVSHWVAEKLKGHLVALNNPRIIQQIFENQQHLPAFLLVKNNYFSNDNFQILRSFCQTEQNQIKCGYADESHEIYQGIYSFLKLDNKQHSFLILLDYQIRNGYKVPNPTSITAASLKQFLQDVNQGKIQKYYDQMANKKQKQIKYEHVVMLADQNFNKTIQTNKYVFVQYYSTSCRYCVQFAAEYEQLAHKFKEEKSQYIIAAVDMDEQQAIRQYVKVNGYPTFRFYARGEELDYQGDRNMKSIIAYMKSVQKNKLKTISNISDIVRPAIVIYGINQDSIFHLLPFVYTGYPIYQFLGASPTFKVQIHQKKYSALQGQTDLSNIANWLYQQTEPTVVNIVGSKNSKKLSTALEEHLPLLILVKRDNSSNFKKTYQFFESFCSDKIEYLCGIARKQEIQYQNFNQWLGEQNNSTNSLVYVNTQKFQRYVYEGDLSKLNQDRVNQFIKNVKDRKINSTQHSQQDSDQQTKDNTNINNKDAQLTIKNNSSQQIKKNTLNDQL